MTHHFLNKNGFVVCGVRGTWNWERAYNAVTCKRCRSTKAWNDARDASLRESERDERYERAAARARHNDFERTSGRDWT